MRAHFHKSPNKNEMHLSIRPNFDHDGLLTTDSNKFLIETFDEHRNCYPHCTDRL